jgi:type VI secretion system secreted protein VgrG
VNSVFKGNLLVQESITLASGASLEGRALTKVGAVTLDTNIIMVPTP